MDTDMIQNLLYTMTRDDVKRTLSTCTNSITLHVYAYNYNWNNGFELPQVILKNPACTLGTALMIFYSADGYRYLIEKNKTSEIPDWLSFISGLYDQICAGCFTDTSISFSVPLSKVQIFKLKKQLNENEQIFTTSIVGENCDIIV